MTKQITKILERRWQINSQIDNRLQSRICWKAMIINMSFRPTADTHFTVAKID